MREKRNIIDIPKASASDNTTAFSSPELNSIGYFTQAGKKYEYVKWGDNDQLPYEMIDKVERNSVLSQNKLFNLLTCYSRGIEYMDIPAEGEEPKPTKNKDIRRFLMRNSMKKFFAEQITDMKYFYFCVCVVILNRNRDKIVKVYHKDVCNCRFEKPDENGNIRHVFYGSWRNNTSKAGGEDKKEVIPLLDFDDPLGDLLARTDNERDTLGYFKRSPQSQTKFAIVCKFPTAGGSVYPVPAWTASVRDGWYDIYNYLTRAKKAKLKNGQNIRYHAEISTAFWENLALSKNIPLNSDEFNDMKDEFMQNIKEYLSGSENSDKLIWSEFSVLPDGKEMHQIKISTVDTTKAGNEYNDDVAEAANVLCYGDNVHPNLAGANPGKSQMNNSGSDKRELFTMKQSLETLTHDLMMVAHNTFIFFNNWQDLVYPEVPIIQLTTLDEHKDMEEVLPNSQQNS